jgi:hypothetical protein
MGRTCGMCGTEEKCIQEFVVKSEGRIELLRGRG